MVTDRQVRRLMSLLQQEQSLQVSADKVGMNRETARKYRKAGQLPGALRTDHDWRTRTDPFVEVWPWVAGQLSVNPGLEAKTLLEALQRTHPGRFADGQLRTLQRQVKRWRGLEGPGREVFFAQVHHPGRLGQSDFSHMTKLGVRIGGRSFELLVYHFVLTYSNWEAFTICYSESFESLSEGLQNALWELGGVPQRHRTDRLSAAVANTSNLDEFTLRYQGLLEHYGLLAEKTNPDSGNENGDVEQRHHRFKRAVDQALMLRGSRDFADVGSYEQFLKALTEQLNRGRRSRFAEELKVIRGLPPVRLEAVKRLAARVDCGSLIHVDRNAYSVNSRLIGQKVEVRLYVGHLEVWYGQKKVEELPRLRGRNQHRVNYRHVIDWLVRKPGAFADYRYQADLFPGSLFRVAYDRLKSQYAGSADKQYLKILELAARESQSLVEAAIGRLCDLDQAMSFEAVEALVLCGQKLTAPTCVRVDEVVRTLMDGSFVDRKENVLAFGNPGSGKTHLLCAIGQELVRAGRRVYFRSTNLLVQELLLAKRELKLPKAIKKLSRYQALILDDLGYVQQSREEMEVLFTLLAERYERGSVLITSNLPFSKWESIFKDAMTTAAAIDRLVHHSVILELNLPSYRVEQAKKSKAAAAPAETSAAGK